MKNQVGKSIDLAKHSSGQKELHDLFSKYFPKKEPKKEGQEINHIVARNVDEKKVPTVPQANFVDKLINESKTRTQQVSNLWINATFILQIYILFIKKKRNILVYAFSLLLGFLFVFFFYNFLEKKMTLIN
ncbi:hypothetical protein RFI_21711 [Reticulomyxa filosa]|uniref:Uncharacterized protein n=1 Tax=Reticulomyxa filosa TaxID=46433 RepID=X6MRB8_RETFI|nr:hypothetical protein RFI_21711 [Reticulomyxa filosa]|eukprot:ETO15655.1 hypothetical protein RFI_21711 [Reticulomyxa filosa]